MNKFKWFNSIRELDPSEENKFIITSLDGVIENISKLHTFYSIFENMGYIDLYPENIEKNYNYCNGNLKNFLEKQFIAISKVNWHGCFPPLYYWVIDFNKLVIELTEKQMQGFLFKNYNLNKDKIQHTYADNFELTTNIYYNLTENKFTSSI